MSMQKSTCPTPEADETLCTLSIISHDGLGHYQFPISLPAHAANILLAAQPPLRVEIWKRFEQQLVTGTKNMVRWQLYPQSYSPLNPHRGTDG